GGIELSHLEELVGILGSVILSSAKDRWRWTKLGSGEFTVALARSFRDDYTLPNTNISTRWSPLVPIKVNFLAWRLAINKLAMRVNLYNRGIEVNSVLCGDQKDEFKLGGLVTKSFIGYLVRGGSHGCSEMILLSSLGIIRTVFVCFAFCCRDKNFRIVCFIVIFGCFVFSGACMGLHQKHLGVKTDGSASVGVDFSLVLVRCNW
nr:RNA-directed DNA polymerase, eukaryota [Tanacetum cinerariifolium]